MQSQVALVAVFRVYPAPSLDAEWNLPDGSNITRPVTYDPKGTDTFTTTLVITSVQATDFGLYNITVGNTVGETLFHIELQDKALLSTGSVKGKGCEYYCI